MLSLVPLRATCAFWTRLVPDAGHGPSCSSILCDRSKVNSDNFVRAL